MLYFEEKLGGSGFEMVHFSRLAFWSALSI
jgi:hypothetical protein